MVVVSEYVSSIILSARVIAVIGNIVLFYLLVVYMLHRDDTEPGWQTHWIWRLGRPPLKAICIFVLWWFFPLIAVVFAPDSYRAELLHEILDYQPLISLPFAPLLLMVVSGHDDRGMKQRPEKAD